MNLGVVSYNLWRSNTADNVKADLQTLMDMDAVDMICTQETATWYPIIKELVDASNADWDATLTLDRGRGPRQNCILWRTDTLVIDHERDIDVLDRAPIDRWIKRARFRLRRWQKRRLVVLATHGHSHVENPAWWRLRRYADYLGHVQLLARLAGRVRPSRAVLVAADWNVNFRRGFVRRAPGFPARVLGRAGLRSNWDSLGFDTRGTHGNRYIDAIFLRRTRWIRPVAHRTLQLSSDHRALLVTYQIKEP